MVSAPLIIVACWPAYAVCKLRKQLQHCPLRPWALQIYDIHSRARHVHEQLLAMAIVQAHLQMPSMLVTLAQLLAAHKVRHLAVCRAHKGAEGYLRDNGLRLTHRSTAADISSQEADGAAAAASAGAAPAAPGACGLMTSSWR